MRVAGIMSGTSLDGVDVAIADIGRKIKTLAASTTPYPKSVRDALLAVSDCDCQTRDISRLHFLLPELYAKALYELCLRERIPPESIELIGCHGQTIFHEGMPVTVSGHRVASTLQIGDGSVLAERTGRPVVSDFRARDIAAGGRGAPLVPFLDYQLFRDRNRGRVALNLGGIANITALKPAGSLADVFAFDTGPGNMVMDQLVEIHTNGRLRYDRDGRIASRGRASRELLGDLMRDRYYAAPPPKTAGREQYGRDFIARLRATRLPMEDLVATACLLTASTVANAIGKFVRTRQPVDDIIAGGGGVHNPVLIRHLADLLPGARVTTTAEFGIDPDVKEAVAFAVMARETWLRRPSNVPSATGAHHPVILGKISPA